MGWSARCAGLVTLALFVAPPLHAQQALSLDIVPHWASGSRDDSCKRRAAACVAVAGEARQGVDNQHLRQRNVGLMVGSALAVGFYGRQKWWRDGFSSDFKSADENWFGRHTYSGGADKLGHFFMNYGATRLLTKAFVGIGNAPAASVNMAAWLTLGTFTAVEVLDGYSKKWRFSKEDALVNAAGVAAGVLLERNPALDQLIDIRMLYWPSRESGRDFAPFSDYSGQTYLLVAKASGMASLREHALLRYVEFAVGYRARGYSDVSGRLVQVGTRSIYAGVSLNLSALLRDTAFKGATRTSRVQAATDTVLEFVQIPGSAVLGRIGLDD